MDPELQAQLAEILSLINTLDRKLDAITTQLDRLGFGLEFRDRDAPEETGP
jgi:hypothetical protein